MGEFVILENGLQNIVICCGILFISLVFKRFLSVQFNKFIYRFLKSISNDIPVKEFVNLLRTPIELFITLLLIYFAFSVIEYPVAWHLSPSRKFGMKMLIEKGYQLLLFLSVAWSVFRIIDFFALVLKKQAIDTESKVEEQLVQFMRQLTKLVLVLLFFFVDLGIIFKINVGALIAGLGIGGLAIALAGKETLENLLVSFAIFVDCPFVTGDLIKAAGYTGSVESVGFRTTRIRTVDKSLLTIPNKQLVDQPLENLSSRSFYRAKMNICLHGSTPAGAVKTIIHHIKHAIAAQTKTNENFSVFLNDISGKTLEVTVFYDVETVEYGEFWEVKEALNYDVKQIIEIYGRESEVQTSVVYLKNENVDLIDQNPQAATHTNETL